ncbi:hypothetical protein [Oceanobacillus sp. CAU 1775]
MTELLAQQPYVKVVREVDSLKQVDTEQERTMFLYEDRVVTKYREFPIEQVIDISYRFIGKEGGFLYLHTNRGVFSYIVKVSPEAFVNIFKDYKNSQKGKQI